MAAVNGADAAARSRGDSGCSDERTLRTSQTGRLRTALGHYVANGRRADLARVEASSTAAIGELSAIQTA